MRIVRQPDVVEAGFLDQLCVPVVRVRRDRIADIGIFLVPVHAAQERRLAVDQQAVLGKAEAADADARLGAVDGTAASLHQGHQPVEVGRLRRPKPWRGQADFLDVSAKRPGAQIERAGRGRDQPVTVEQLVRDRRPCTRAVVADVCSDLNLREIRSDQRIRDEQPAAGDAVLEHLVAEVDGRLHDQSDATIEAAVGVEVEVLERLWPGDPVVAIVEPDSDPVLGAEAQLLRQVDREGQISAEVRRDRAVVERHGGHVHRRLDPQQHRLARP